MTRLMWLHAPAMPVVPSRRPPKLGSGSRVSALVLAALLAGCGSGSSTTVVSPSPKVKSANIEASGTISGPSSLLVTRQDVAAAGKHSPYGALLAWWRALQAEDVGTARAAYATSVDTSAVGGEIRRLSYPPELDYRGNNPLPPYALPRSRPGLLHVTKRDGTARVSTVVNAAVFDKSDPSKPVLVTHTPAAFHFTRSAGGWKLADDDYLAQTLTARVESTR